MSSSAPAVALGNLTISDQDFDRLRQLIYRETGITLADSKRALLCSRLGRRLRHHGMEDFGDYYRMVSACKPGDPELTELINSITTNKTDFFREKMHFEFMTQEVLPPLLARGERPLRIWCSASSTGEEPYTIAMTVAEALGSRRVPVRILASDIDTQVLAHAAAGVYDEDRLADVPVPLVRKYFLQGKGAQAGKLRVRPELQRMIEFRRINLVGDQWELPEREFDIIFCRNVVIYFDRETQRKLFDRFTDVLAPEGYLFIGHSESLHGISERLAATRGTIYRHAGAAGTRGVSPVVTRPVGGESAGGKAPVERAAPAEKPSRPERAPRAVSTAGPAVPAGEAPRGEAPSEARAAGVLQRSGGHVSRLAAAAGLKERSIVVGEVEATREECVIRTLLGSCVSACLYDEELRAGGMNHFLLPLGHEDEAASARYGVHAMELLINELMRLGADRRRLRAKVFGGAEVLRFQGSTPRVAAANAKFVREFLANEKIPIIAERLGGQSPLEVRFMPHTAKAFVRAVESRSAATLADDEARYSQALVQKTRSEAAALSNVDLF